MSSTVQNLLIIFGLVVIAGLGYYLYTQNTSSQLNTSDGLIANQASIESAAFLRRLNELKEVSLDPSLFSDPRFQSLQNNRPTVVELPVGRNNPFESID